MTFWAEREGQLARACARVGGCLLEQVQNKGYSSRDQKQYQDNDYGPDRRSEHHLYTKGARAPATVATSSEPTGCRLR